MIAVVILAVASRGLDLESVADTLRRRRVLPNKSVEGGNRYPTGLEGQFGSKIKLINQ